METFTDCAREPLRLGLVQTCAGPSALANLSSLSRLLREPVFGTCDLIVLPESVLSLGRGETIRRSARRMVAWVALLRSHLRRLPAPTLFGGVPVCQGDRVVNAAVLLSPDWQVLGRYDKIHLFQFQSQGAGALDETRVYSPGIEPVVINVKGWRICLSICYDIRFPELYRACLPFDLLMCTAAFTAETGDAHWQPLLRARAIENLCYVAGIGLCGVNQETGLQLHGNSMVVDPWGTVVHHCGRQPETAVVVLHPQGIQSARSRLPALANRRLV